MARNDERTDPMREHRRREAKSSGLVFLTLLIAIPTCAAGATTGGWIIMIAGVAMACWTYYR